MEFMLTKYVAVSLQLVVVMTCFSWGIAEHDYKQIAREGCQDDCSGIKIPFPFGIGHGCYHISDNDFDPRDMYRITCDNTNTSTNPKPLLPTLGNREVLGINLIDHSIRISSGVAYDCHTTGESVPSASPNISYTPGDVFSMPIKLSKTRNKFIVIGCESNASLWENHAFDYIGLEAARCTTSCPANPVGDDGICDPFNGCCESPIIENTTGPSVYVSNSYTNPFFSYPCSYAFVAEMGSFTFYEANLTATAKDCYGVRVPVVYDWFLNSYAYTHCSKAKAAGYDSVKKLCSSHSMFECVEYNGHTDFTMGNLLLTCQCLEGYRGNPYLPNGCQDINECVDERLTDCQRQEYCVNTNGGYDCRCPKGYLGNATIASPCIPIATHSAGKLILGFSIGVSFGIGFVVLYGVYKLIKRRKEIKERKHNFKRNGGLLLQQKMSMNAGAIDRTKIFSRIELEKATDNFNDNRVLGRGGQGTVYKGMLTDGTIVAVKKSMKVDETQLASFINEVVVLSHINHRNVVKLFGCCLETDVPLLVYEFVPNGTLHQHIHHPGHDFHMTWNVRFHTAVDCAAALAYLHSSCSSPIYHRDIKSSNILLDRKYKAKISDFGTSKSISIDQTHVTTGVKGTFGYLDPEFFQTHRFSDKSDVYSFGVVLLELITGKKPILRDTTGEQIGLAAKFRDLRESSPSQMHEILDTQVSQDCSQEEIEALAKLIERCLSMNGKERPTMIEVTMALEMIKPRHKEEENQVVGQGIREEEAHVWISEGMGITDEDPSITIPR